MPQFSTKRLAINKAYATILLAVGITTFVTVFSLVACKALYSQMRYQSKVSSKKETALKTLKANLQTSDQLITSYEAFANETTNVLGGNPKGDGPNDGDNPRIVLDALPSKYDFPALTTSIEKLLHDKGFSITSITGNDDEVIQSAQDTSAEPQPVEMPFSVDVTTSDQRVKQLIQLFEKSIRPIQVHQMNLQSQNGQVKVTVTAKTFYQPEKSLNVTSEVVK